MYNDPNSTVSILGDTLQSDYFQRPRRSVYLEAAQSRYSTAPKITKVAPAPHPFLINDGQWTGSIIYDLMKPMLMIERVFGISPIGAGNHPGTFKVSLHWLVYSCIVFLLVVGYVGYIKWDRIELMRTAEGRFEEAVIDYLFSVYLVPIVLVPLTWYESFKLARVLTDWCVFERIYFKISNKKLDVFLGNRPLLITVVTPLLAVGTMIVTHITMSFFRFLQVVPYCYINVVTYLIGGSWYLQCDVLGKTAALISEDFQLALKNVGPASNVANYRSLWMQLTKLTRNTGNALGYTLIFLCLYLFLIITLTIYGLLSQIQEGFGVKDIGLTVTATFAIALLYFVCDEAHYASSSVRVLFQKKLLLVELAWMNEDAQQEINMFLRATEMHPTDMSLDGFFDVDRNLFKSLLATMVTYLVVLLQFQISIPEDRADRGNRTISDE